MDLLGVLIGERREAWADTRTLQTVSLTHSTQLPPPDALAVERA